MTGSTDLASNISKVHAYCSYPFSTFQICLLFNRLNNSIYNFIGKYTYMELFYYLLINIWVILLLSSVNNTFSNRGLQKPQHFFLSIRLDIY